MVLYKKKQVWRKPNQLPAGQGLEKSGGFVAAFFLVLDNTQLYMKVERDGVMWLPDNGRQLGVRDTARCPAKLVLLDLATRQLRHTHTFPEAVVPRRRGRSFLNDIALSVARPGEEHAYISDSERGVLVVFSLARDSSWVVAHSSMRGRHVTDG